MTHSLISPLDDYPVHQIPDLVRVVGPSDRNFYDRYYFMMHNRTEDIVAVFGLGLYPNLHVMDCFATVRRGNKQLIVRASKELGDRADMSIGPFKLEIIEGLKKMRWRLEPNEFGLSMDVTWDAAAPPHAEMPRIRHDRFGRLTYHGARYNQVGYWSGHLNVDGDKYAVEPPVWSGVRDRSWGIRPVGEPEPERATMVDYPGLGEPAKGSAQSRMAESHFFIWAPMLFEDQAISCIMEERNGVRTLQDAARIRKGETTWEDLGRPDHDIEFVPGTRLFKRVRFTFNQADGETLVVYGEPMKTVWTMMGTGYGQSDHFRHGKPMGKLFADSVRYDLDDPVVMASMRGVLDGSARFQLGDKVGYGEINYVVAGPNQKYGFKTPDDVAR
jgi:hypothetical protein